MTETPTPEQRRAFTPEQRAAQDRRDLDAALTIVRKHCPTAVAVNVETSDQGRYGFVLTGIEYPDGSVVTPDVSALPYAADDAVSDLLSDLNWNGVMGESAQGYARLALPAGPEDDVTDHAVGKGAERAAAVLAAYRGAAPDGRDDAETLQDLLTDLMHWSAVRIDPIEDGNDPGDAFDRLHESARWTHFPAETRGIL